MSVSQKDCPFKTKKKLFKKNKDKKRMRNKQTSKKWYATKSENVFPIQSQMLKKTFREQRFSEKTKYLDQIAVYKILA